MQRPSIAGKLTKNIMDVLATFKTKKRTHRHKEELRPSFLTVFLVPIFELHVDTLLTVTIIKQSTNRTDG